MSYRVTYLTFCGGGFLYCDMRQDTHRQKVAFSAKNGIV